MPTSYTSNLRLANPGLGDTGWGATVSNGMIDLTDQAIAGQASVNVTAAGPFVLTMPDGVPGDARNMFLRFTGTPGGAREVQVPTNRKLYFVTNDSDGAVTVKVSGQTGVVVPVGASMALRINAAGTDVVQALTYQASLTLSTALAATSGGTGQSSYAVGDLLYANTTTTLAKLAGVATGNALLSGGVGVAPAWGKVGLTTHVSGTLPVGNGGTGATTLTGYVKGNGTGAMTASATVPVADLTGTLPVANGGTGAATLAANNVLLGNGTSAVQAVAPGTSGNVLTSNGTTWTSATPASAYVGQNIQIFTSNGTFTVPSGVTKVKATIVGGGGPGGNFTTGGSGPGAAGGGGGGAVAVKWVDVTAGASYSVTVGGSGGSSTFGSITAGGGATGGTGSLSSGGAGGAGGAVTDTSSWPGFTSSGSAGIGGDPDSGIGGAGGYSGAASFAGRFMWGVGAQSNTSGTNATNGSAGAIYGGGGSGAARGMGSGGASGGTGAQGVVIFEW